MHYRFLSERDLTHCFRKPTVMFIKKVQGFATFLLLKNTITMFDFGYNQHRSVGTVDSSWRKEFVKTLHS